MEATTLVASNIRISYYDCKQIKWLHFLNLKKDQHP